MIRAAIVLPCAIITGGCLTLLVHAQSPQPASQPSSVQFEDRGPAAAAPPASRPSAESVDDPAAGRPFGPEKLQLDYVQSGYFSRPVKEQDTSFSSLGEDLSLRLPLQREKQQSWDLLGRIARWDYNTDARIPGQKFWQPSQDFPDHMWDLELGTLNQFKLNNGWTAGALVTVGSRSDRPFASEHEWNVNANAFLRIPDGELNAWLIYVNYSNTRTFLPDVPLPGFGYEFADDAKNPVLRGLLGIPRSDIRWQPLDWLALSGAYLFPTAEAKTEAALLLEGWEIFTGWDFESDNYLWAERRENDDLLFYYEQRIKGGFRTPRFWENKARVEFEAGYAFDRQWFVGEEFDDRDGRSSFDIDSGPYLKVQLRLDL